MTSVAAELFHREQRDTRQCDWCGSEYDCHDSENGSVCRDCRGRETCGTCNGDGEGGTYYGDGSPRPCPDCRGEGLAPLSSPMPECMGPDGAEPCAAYTALLNEVVELRRLCALKQRQHAKTYLQREPDSLDQICPKCGSSRTVHPLPDCPVSSSDRSVK